MIELFANRFMLREDFSDDANELNKTLGKIPIIFSDNQEVISCYKRMFLNRNDETLLNLIKSVCMDKTVNIDISKWDDKMIMKTLFYKIKIFFKYYKSV